MYNLNTRQIILTSPIPHFDHYYNLDIEKKSSTRFILHSMPHTYGMKCVKTSIVQYVHYQRVNNVRFMGPTLLPQDCCAPLYPARTLNETASWIYISFLFLFSLFVTKATRCVWLISPSSLSVTASTVTTSISNARSILSTKAKRLKWHWLVNWIVCCKRENKRV